MGFTEIERKVSDRIYIIQNRKILQNFVIPTMEFRVFIKYP
jgi:hypothetical protein